jgi:hypothetical protein
MLVFDTKFEVVKLDKIKFDYVFFSQIYKNIFYIHLYNNMFHTFCQNNYSLGNFLTRAKDYGLKAGQLY